MELASKNFSNLHRKHSIYKIANNPQKQLKTKYRKLSHETNLKTLHHFANNEWMKKHGKGIFIDFNSKERAKIRSIFKELDRDGSGALGIDELYEPLLAFGLVESKEQVKKMMAKVDSNGSGVIEFEEFVRILKNTTNDNNALVSFLKEISDENTDNAFQDLPFNLIFSNRRRELMLQSYIGKSQITRDIGKKVLSAYALEIEEKETNRTKLEKLVIKKDINLQKLLLRKNGLKLVKKDIKGLDSSFLRNISRPQSSSSRPMTRKEILRY